MEIFLSEHKKEDADHFKDPLTKYSLIKAKKGMRFENLKCDGLSKPIHQILYCSLKIKFSQIL